MFFPVIPLACLIAILGGGGGLYWYSQLSKEEKERADRLAADYALEHFGKELNELTTDEAHHVNGLTKRHFTA